MFSLIGKKNSEFGRRKSQKVKLLPQNQHVFRGWRVVWRPSKTVSDSLTFLTLICYFLSFQIYTNLLQKWDREKRWLNCDSKVLLLEVELFLCSSASSKAFCLAFVSRRHTKKDSHRQQKHSSSNKKCGIENCSEKKKSRCN